MRLKRIGEAIEEPPIRVVLYGVGAMGGSIAKALLKREGIKIVGAIDIAEDKVGRDLGEVLGLESHMGITVSDDPDGVLSRSKADIAIHATSSFLKDVYPQISTMIKHGVNVVSTCEELTYPYITDLKLADKLDSLAREYGVTVLGTGINPGFLMDTLVIVLTSVCQEVESIRVERAIDASKRRVPFQKKIGAGLKVEEFKAKMKTGLITGHVGLKQSVAMIAEALGWRLDEIRVMEAEPVRAEGYVKTEAVEVKPGDVAGLRQRAYGIIDGEKVITLDFKAYLGADEYDAITIRGVPDVNERITPCIHGDLGTVAMIINSIPKVLKASPGLKTMLDLTLPSASLGDMRLHIRG